MCVCVWKKRKGIGVTSVGYPWLELGYMCICSWMEHINCHCVSWQFDHFPLVHLILHSCTVPFLGFSTMILPSPQQKNFIGRRPSSRLLSIHVYNIIEAPICVQDVQHYTHDFQWWMRHCYSCKLYIKYYIGCPIYIGHPII